MRQIVNMSFVRESEGPAVFRPEWRAVCVGVESPEAAVAEVPHAQQEKAKK